jgi:hypothetical protein
MTWAEANAATLLLAEEQIGTRVRSAEAREDAKFERTKAELRRVTNGSR